AMGFSDLAKNQKKAPPGRGFKNFFADISGGRLYPCRLCTLRTLGDFVLDTQAFLETAKAFRIDRRIVHEDIGAAVLRRDESESLGVVEPLHCAVLHDSSNLVMAGGARPAAARPPVVHAEYAKQTGGLQSPAQQCR